MEQKGKIIALGFFDGVHLGHRAILSCAKDMARKLDMTSAALTFESHPRSFVLGIMPQMLTTPSERAELISAFGIEQVIVLPFNEDVAGASPEDFVERILIEQYGCAGIVCGESFRFGKNASGNPQLLEKMGKELGLSVNICKTVQDGAMTISSTAIRKALAMGEPERARELLGRPYSLQGVVVSGVQVGRKIGYPTINTRTPDGILIPHHGVYASSVRIEGSHYAAVTNIGTRPTFTDADITTVETHILNYSGNAYGSAARVYFLKYLRQEQAFRNAELLRTQIASDIKAAIDVCHGEGL